MSEFKLSVPLSTEYVIRSETADDGSQEEWLYIEGEVSDTSWDQKKGKVYPDAIRSMVATANGATQAPVFNDERTASAVTIDSEHCNHWNHQIGDVVEARVIERASGPAMYVKARVDMAMSAGKDLKRRLDRGKKLGWSIYGTAKGFKDNEGRDHFKSIDLKKIAITSQPVNQNTWMKVVARSMDRSEDLEDIKSEEGMNLSDETPQTPEREVKRSEEEPSAQLASGSDTAQAPVEEVAPTPTFAEAYRAFSALVAPMLDSASLDIFDKTADGIIRKSAEPTEEAAAESRETVPLEETPAEVPVEAPVEVTKSLGEVAEDNAPPALVPINTEVALGSIARSTGEEIDELKEVIRSMGEQLETKTVSMAAVEGTLDDVVKHVNKLTEVLNAIVERPLGRRGAIARSFGREYDPAPSETSGPPSQQRINSLRQLTEKGRGDLATQVIVGLMTLEDAAKQLPPS